MRLLKRSSASKLTKEDAPLALGSTLLVVTSTNLNTDATAIQSTYLPTFLSKMGINRMSAAAFRSGPALHGSMGILEVWTQQGIGGNKLLLGHLRKEDLTGKMLQVELDALQLHAGTSWDVLSQPGQQLHDFIKRSWSSNIWKFNNNYRLSI